MENKQRYFIVFCTCKSGSMGANCNTAFKSDRYPSNKEICKNISLKTVFKETEIIVTGINEITETDYINWNS